MQRENNLNVCLSGSLFASKQTKIYIYIQKLTKNKAAVQQRVKTINEQKGEKKKKTPSKWIESCILSPDKIFKVMLNGSSWNISGQAAVVPTDNSTVKPLCKWTGTTTCPERH